MLRSLAPDLWVTERPQSFFGLEIGTRMTVVRLGGGALWVHSPVEPDEELCKELSALGTVRFVVAPNRFHHLYAGSWASAAPESRLWLAPGLREKRPDLADPQELTGEAPAEWADEIEQVLLEGAPLSNEVVFFHEPTRTLIATDLAFHVGQESTPLVRLVFRLSGGYGRLATTLVERLIVRDEQAARRSLERILEWPFERVIVSHGGVLEKGGPEDLRRAWSWLV